MDGSVRRRQVSINTLMLSVRIMHAIYAILCMYVHTRMHPISYHFMYMDIEEHPILC